MTTIPNDSFTYEAVTFAAWYKMCSALLHLMLIIFLYQKNCCKPCTSLTVALIAFSLSLLVFVQEAFTLSTYWIQWNDISSNYQQICDVSESISGAIYGTALSISLCVFLIAFEETFSNAGLLYPKRLLKGIKIVLFIVTTGGIATVMISSARSSIIVTVVQLDNPQLCVQVCVGGPRPRIGTYLVFMTTILFEAIQLVTLYLFISRTYKVCVHVWCTFIVCHVCTGTCLYSIVRVLLYVNDMSVCEIVFV